MINSYEESYQKTQNESINSLFKNLSEDLNANYHDEQEKEIFQENIEVKNLIETLNQLEKPSDETET